MEENEKQHKKEREEDRAKIAEMMDEALKQRDSTFNTTMQGLDNKVEQIRREKKESDNTMQTMMRILENAPWLQQTTQATGPQEPSKRYRESESQCMDEDRGQS